MHIYADYIFVSFFYFVLLLQPIDSLQRFQFDFGGCCFVFSSCHPYPTSLILAQHCFNIVQICSNSIKHCSNIIKQSNPCNLWFLPWNLWHRSARFCTEQILAVISLPLRHSCATHSISSTQIVLTASPTWAKSLDESPLISISADVCAFSHYLCSQCGRGWRRKHWVWLFYWCIVKQQSCTLMNNRMQHIVQLQQQLDTFRVQDLLWLAHDHFDHSQSFWIIPTELKWPSWRIEWDLHWSEGSASSPGMGMVRISLLVLKSMLCNIEEAKQKQYRSVLNSNTWGQSSCHILPPRMYWSKRPSGTENVVCSRFFTSWPMKLMDAHGISCSRLELKKCSGIGCNAKGVLNQERDEHQDRGTDRNSET